MKVKETYKTPYITINICENKDSKNYYILCKTKDEKRVYTYKTIMETRIKLEELIWLTNAK